MPKFNETLTTQGYFEIDDKPHQKGGYDLDANPSTEKVGIYRLANNGARTYLVQPVIYSDWTNSSDTPYASYAALITDFTAGFFLTKSSVAPVGNIETLSTAETSTFKSLRPDGVGGVNWVDSTQNLILVNQNNYTTTLSNIDGSKQYLLDGVVDVGSFSIEVPVGGVNIIGYDFNTSGLISSEDSYKMFTSPVGGSGDILWSDFKIEVTGTNSQVLDVFSATGFDAFEIARINYNNCTSLGEVNNYRQGLETGTGRFGGTPEMTLSGVWLGGFFIDTSIVRNLTDGAYTLYKAGTGFSMASRFRSNQNIDLPATTSFFDFAPSNFVNPSTVQIEGALISRNGVFNANDSTIIPNMTRADLVSNWKGNNGIPNTFEGGSVGVTTESAKTIPGIGTFVDLEAAVWTALDLQHFDNPSGNQLRHLGNSPREYKVIADFTLDSAPNDVLNLRVRKYDDSLASSETVLVQARQVNSLVGGRDVAFFSININVELDQNDYIFLEVSNQTSTTNVTAELDSYYIVEER